MSYMKNYMQIRVYEEGRSPKEQNQLGYLLHDCCGGYFSKKLEKAGGGGESIFLVSELLRAMFKSASFPEQD